MKRHIAGVLALAILALWPAAEATGQTDDLAAAEAKIKGDKEAARPYWQKGAEAYKAGKGGQAVVHFEKAFELYPHWSYQYSIGQAYRRAADYLKAIEAYKRYVELCPKPEALVWLRIGECDIKAYGAKSNDAKKAFEKYLQLEPNGSYAEQARVAINTGVAPCDQDLRDPETLKQAIALFDQANKLANDAKYKDATAAFLQGWEKYKMPTFLKSAAACAKVFDRAKAAELWEQYLKTPGPREGAWDSLAWNYHMMGNYAKACETYERYLKLHPRGTHVSAAYEYVRLYKGPKSAKPTDADWTLSREAITRAEEHFRAKRYQKALEEFQNAEKAVPQRSTGFNIGMCHVRLEHYSDALRRFETMLRERCTAEDGHIRLNAAECCLKMREYDKAAAHVKEFHARYDASAANAQANLAWARQLEADIKKAKKKGGARRPRVPGPEHPRVTAALTRTSGDA